MRSGACTGTREGKPTSLRSTPAPATPVRVRVEELDRVSLLIVTVKVYAVPMVRVFAAKVIEASLAFVPRILDPNVLVHIALSGIVHVHRYVILSLLVAVD